MAPIVFQLAPNFTLIVRNIYKIALRKYKIAPGKYKIAPHFCSLTLSKKCPQPKKGPFFSFTFLFPLRFAPNKLYLHPVKN